MLRFSALAAIAKVLLGTVLAAGPNVIVLETGVIPRSIRDDASWTTLASFHVGPTPEASRATVLTGLHEFRSGLGDPATGRSRLAPGIPTMAGIFRKGGYRTGLFGTWGLGEAFPCRPEDRGFDEIRVHGGFARGSTPDHWGNSETERMIRTPKGWEKDPGTSAAALHWIEETPDQPFYAFISTRDPAENLTELLKQIPGDTLVAIINAPVGLKPFAESICMIRWPGKISAGRKIGDLTSSLDLLPTLTTLCGVTKPGSWSGDGVDLSEVLAGKGTLPKNRLLFSQLGNWPSDESASRFRARNFSVRDARWRLTGLELFDLQGDPESNVFETHPDEATRLLTDYGRWWESVLPAVREPVRYIIGAKDAPLSRLTSYDWWPSNETETAGAVLTQQAIRDLLQAARVAKTRNSLPSTSGHWKLDIAREGNYEIVFSLLPPEASEQERKELAQLKTGIAHVRIGKEELRLAIKEGATSFKVPMDLDAGPTNLEIWFDGQLLNDRILGAFFASMEYKGIRKAPKPEFKPKELK